LSSLTDFLSELRRRKVVKVLVVYTLVAIGVIEAADLMLPRLGLPDWSVTLVVALAVLGLPLALVLSWVFDVTADGVVRTSASASSTSGAGRTDGRAGALGLGSSDEPSNTTSEALRGFASTSLAVLPFENLSDDRDNEFFALGIVDDLVVQLAQIHSLHVAARPALSPSALRGLGVKEIARSFEVGSVLQGSVRRAGGRVRVAAQLVDADSNKHLWAETYDRELDDVFAVQSDIAQRIAEALGAELAHDEIEYLDRVPTRNMEAYDLFLRGKQDLYRESAMDIARGMDRLRHAIDLDPEFAAVHAAMGLGYAFSPWFAGASGLVAFPEARRATERAIQLDERQALAWVVEAAVKYLYEWDWRGAELDFERAIQLDANLIEQHMFRGHFYGLMRRFSEALAVYEAIQTVDQLGVQRMHGVILVIADRAEEALVLLDELVRSDPTVFEHHSIRALALAKLGRYDEAAESNALAAQLSGGHPLYLATQALDLQRAGRPADARRVGEQAQQALEAIPNHEARCILAIGDGDLESAAAAAEAAADARSPMVLWFRSWPGCEPLWDHPRFEALVQRIWPDEFEQQGG
jgi:TolB-like protein